MLRIKVLYDYQIFLLQRWGGISRYFRQITDYFKYRDDVDVILPLVRSQNYYFRDYCRQNVRRPFMHDAFFNSVALYKEYIAHRINKDEINILHPTYYYPTYLKLWPRSWRRQTKIVITVHDLICEMFHPEIEKRLDQRAHTIMNADGIIVISETTKRDLLRVYPQLDPAKIETIYHGVSSASFDYKEKIEIDGDYILFVGARGLYKNGEKYMRALGRIAKENSSLRFVFVGGGSFTKEEAQVLKEEGITTRTQQINASDAQLYYLYSQAKCFVFPSLYEGFGIPILEAFSCGCPVVLSNCSCFPEIAQDAAVYFDADSAEDMGKTIMKVVNDDCIRKELIENGYLRVKEFTIEKTAEKTLDFYRRIANA